MSGLQTQAYVVQALGRAGMWSRENPLRQYTPCFAEADTNGDNVEAGGFVFAGSASNQAVKTASAGTAPIGLAIYEKMQIATNGGTSMAINEGEAFVKALRGCAFVKGAVNTATEGQNVLVDPLTGDIMSSASTSASATAGTLAFASASGTYTDYTSITAGTLSVNVDGTLVALTGLDFHSATDMAGVATVIDTALSTYADCAYGASTGIVITSKTTGASSSVEFVSDSTDLATALGTGVSTDGTNAYVDTGWDVKSGNSAGQAFEAERI